MHAHRCLFKRARVSTRIRPASLSLSATFLYLLSPVDPRQNLAADVAVLSWLWSASPAPLSHRQHSQTTLDLFICAWGKFGNAAVSTPALPLVLKARRR